MKIWTFFLAFVFVAALVSGCVKPPDYPIEPVITYVGLNKTSIPQGNGNAPSDTLIIRFEFTDGDGDLSFESDSIDVYFTDSRDDFVTPFKIPFINEQGTGNGIRGEIMIKVPNKPFNICCTFPDNSPACLPNAQFPIDTFSYTIQIRDRAGHYSNKIQTDKITIRCN